jgi:hypothetical protein
MSRWQARTYLNIVMTPSFSQGKSPSIILRHGGYRLVPAFQAICHRHGRQWRSSVTCVVASVVFDGCLHIRIVGHLWSPFWLLSYNGVFYELRHEWGICLLPSASFWRMDKNKSAEGLPEPRDYEGGYNPM